MLDSERPEFIKAIAALACTFRAEATKLFCEGYWVGLRDLDVEQVQAAAVRAMRTCRFMPSVHELRTLAGVIGPEGRAVVAWEAARRAVSTHGPYRSVSFDDPITAATIRNLGGWPAFDDRLATDGDVWVRKEFERVYVSLCSTGVSEEACGALGGLSTIPRPPERVAVGLPPVEPGTVRTIAAPGTAGALPAAVRQIGAMP